MKLVLLAACAVLLSGQTFVPRPAWDCLEIYGIESPDSGKYIFEITTKLDRIADIGKTPFGNRRVAVGLDGSVASPKLSATVMAGALDFELTLANGTVETEDILVLKTNDGKYIYSRSLGLGPAANAVHVKMDFEAPIASDYAWLNLGRYVASRVLDAAAKTLTLRVYDVSLEDFSATVQIEMPENTPACDARKMTPSEKQGTVLIRENVTLGPAQSVGPSKRGNRNIIPITGGELTGRIPGKVLAGGADYQNLNPPATIDARYLWQTNDGEIIIVRNAGPFGALVPTFETRIDGPYAYLNTGSFLSSNPGPGQGGVGITMYESAK